MEARIYEVIGPRPVFEYEPGEQFRRELSAGQEAALLGVHLRIVEPDPPKTTKPAAADPADKPKPESESEEMSDG